MGKIDQRTDNSNNINNFVNIDENAFEGKFYFKLIYQFNLMNYY